MKIEVQFVPVDPGTREERMTSLRRLLMRGALQLCRSTQDLQAQEEKACAVALSANREMRDVG